jgi:two-component system chemotaxis response regulator CheY
MTEATRVFVRKSSESIARMREALESLGKNGNDFKLLGDFYCSVHIIKGACGFLGLANLGLLAEAGEELLQGLRNGSIEFEPDARSLLVQLTDAMTATMRQVEIFGSDGESDFAALVGELKRFSQHEPNITDRRRAQIGNAGSGSSLRDRSWKTALVIDDSMAMRRVLRRILQGLGFEVSEASSGEEGLRKLHDASDLPNVVLVDWMLPEMNGLEFIKRVRSAERFRRVLLIMVTSERHPEARENAIKAGADEYITKPFNREDVILGIQNLGFGRGNDGSRGQVNGR